MTFQVRFVNLIWAAFSLYEYAVELKTQNWHNFFFLIFLALFRCKLGLYIVSLIYFVLYKVSNRYIIFLVRYI